MIDEHTALCMIDRHKVALDCDKGQLLLWIAAKLNWFAQHDRHAGFGREKPVSGNGDVADVIAELNPGNGEVSDDICADCYAARITTHRHATGNLVYSVICNFQIARFAIDAIDPDARCAAVGDIVINGLAIGDRFQEDPDAAFAHNIAADQSIV